MIKKQKKSSDEAALARTEGGAATDPTPEPVQNKPVREPVPPPAPKEEVPESVPDKVEAPPPPAVVDDGKPKVPFKVFAVSCGIKWDQMAGFKSHVKRMKLGPLSILEWREAMADFQKRPVG